MATLYHINGNSVSPCSAQPGNCPFGQGAEENHFSDPKEAMDVLEKRLETEYSGNITSFKKESAAHSVESGESDSAPKNIHDRLKMSNDQIEDLRKQNSKLWEDEKEYDLTHGVAEGRAYYYRRLGEVAHGVNPNGSTFYRRHPDFDKKRSEMTERIKKAEREREDAQTAIEEAGLGHTISDAKDTIRVKTQAQKWLLTQELQGQISDGKWENTKPEDHWKVWSSAKVVVDPKNPGRNFYAAKDNYQLNASDLLDVVGDRMKTEVSERIGDTYDNEEMIADLRDLRKIFKTPRKRLTVSDVE